MKQAFNFSFLNLGCTKNLVDTQYLMGHIFSQATNNPNYNIQYFADPYDPKAEYVFLNTCGFIKAGRDEMLATIDKLVKTQNFASLPHKKIYLLGCGLQYFAIKGGKEKKEARKKETFKPFNLSTLHFLSRSDFENITIANFIAGYSSKTFPDFTFPKQKIQAYTNAAYRFEYLKIAEWCDNTCTFCIIPKLRWKLHSRTIPDIVKDAEQMIKSGIEEIILIAQDTSRYGFDRYGKSALFTLLRRLDRIPGNFNYRLLYLYPDFCTDAKSCVPIIKKFKTLKKFIPYFDIPFQHISKNILKKMWRYAPAVREDTIFPNYPSMISKIKKTFPHSFIRTNIIIGFPGETEENFQELKTFIQKSDFDNIALFEYHDEPLAASSKLPDKVPAKTIRERFLELDKIVDEKLTAKEQARKGKLQTGYIMNIKSSWLETRHSTHLVVRPSLHAPEMDPYDTITLDQITKIYNKTWTISIGDKISYKL